jgi:hypothetical protein
MAEEQLGALTSRDLQAQGLLYDTTPTRGFQDFLVTLPDDPDFPFEIQHTLTPELPTGVRYEVLQSTYPVVLYHNNNDIFAPGVITLRATSGGHQIRIRLTVDDGDANPVLEGDRTAVYTHFPHGLVVQRSSDIGSTITTDRGRISLHPGLYGLDDFGVGGSGPALVMDPNQDGVTDNAWGIQADTTWGSANPRLLIGSSRADTGNWVMALTSDQSNTADVWYLIPGVGATFNLGGDTSELGNPFRINNIKSKGKFYERDRTVPMGEWTTYSPTWTCAAGAAPVLGNGSLTGNYMKIGKTVFVKIRLAAGSTTTFGGGTYLFSLPSTSTTTFDIFLDVRVLDSGTRWYFGKGFGNTATTIMATDDNAGTAFSATYPMVWTTNDQLIIYFVYEEV